MRITVELDLDVEFCEYNDRIEVDVVRSPGQSKNLFLHLDALSQIKIQAETECAIAAAEQERREQKPDKSLRLGSYIAPLRASGSNV